MRAGAVYFGFLLVILLCVAGSFAFANYQEYERILVQLDPNNLISESIRLSQENRKAAVELAVVFAAAIGVLGAAIFAIIARISKRLAAAIVLCGAALVAFAAISAIGWAVVSISSTADGYNSSGRSTLEAPGNQPTVRDYRVWNDASGTHSTTAAFESYSNGSVTLRREDGVVVAVPISALSEKDCHWLRDEAGVGTDSGASPGKAAKSSSVRYSLRRWTSADGKRTVEGELLDYANGVVRLRRTDGAEFEFPVEKLSEDDRAWLESLSP